MLEDSVLQKIENQCKISKISFVDRVFPVDYVEHGVLFSECFAFCALCDLLGVDGIIESGVGNGGSFLVWLKYFGLRVSLVLGIDVKPFSSGLKSRFRGCNYYSYITGDSVVLLPQYIQKYPNNRLGIFIDGPKRESSVALAKECFKFDNVVVVAVHDLHKKEVTPSVVKASNSKLNASRVKFDKWDVPKFCTDEDWFSSYQSLDLRILESPKTFWRPGGYCNHPVFGNAELGSYGFTLGLAFKGL